MDLLQSAGTDLEEIPSIYSFNDRSKVEIIARTEETVGNLLLDRCFESVRHDRDPASRLIQRLLNPL